MACLWNYFLRIIPLHWPPLWHSGQSSCQQIQSFGFDSRRYQTFREVVGLERGSPSLVSTIEELLRRKSSGSGLENHEYGRRDPWRWPCGTLYSQKLALTSPTSGGRLVAIVRSRTKATLHFSYELVWRRGFDPAPPHTILLYFHRTRESRYFITRI
jgi:hypothetical protein